MRILARCQRPARAGAGVAGPTISLSSDQKATCAIESRARARGTGSAQAADGNGGIAASTPDPCPTNDRKEPMARAPKLLVPVLALGLVTACGGKKVEDTPPPAPEMTRR